MINTKLGNLPYVTMSPLTIGPMTKSQNPLRISFPVTLTLEYLIEEWKNFFNSDTKNDELARILANDPRLENLIVDNPSPELLEENEDLLQLLFSSVFPILPSEFSHGIASMPFSIDAKAIFSTGSQAENILREMMSFLSDMDNEFYQNARDMRTYGMILEAIYDVPIDKSFPFVISLKENDGKTERHFAISFDGKYCRCIEKEGAPRLNPDQLKELLSNRSNLALWKEYLPPEFFEVRGLILINAMDVTDNQVVARITNDVLKPNAFEKESNLDHIQMHFATMLQAPHLKFGLIALDTDITEKASQALPFGRSQLLNEDGQMPPCHEHASSIHMKACSNDYPAVYSDLRELEKTTAWEQYLIKKELYNVVLLPIYDGKTLLGLIELTSPIPGEIDSLSALKLIEIVPVFKMALKRSRQEYLDRIEAVIKRECTAIHPSVNWRFNQAAKNHLFPSEGSEKTPFENIVFEGVYPMYGMADIRGSSVLRNKAILSDLREQISLADRLLGRAIAMLPMPMIEEVRFQLSSHKALLDDGLDSGEELQIITFFQRELEPILEELTELGGELKELVEEYRSHLNPEIGLVYNERNKFDGSVMKLNDIVGLYIDGRQDQAQEMIPHYFEMYRTDGVDYTMYAGASLLPNGRFGKLQLQNLRLWQLMVTCEVIWEIEQMAPFLDVHLEVAHLLLVQDSTLSIRFRADEKHFDVDGAYNVRYEIIKKRIDKATIVGTGERLTQPGKIAIVYSQPKELKEYKRYLNYLVSKEYILPEIEELEIQPLQGVQGLKALRVKASPNQQENRLSVELIERATSGDGSENRGRVELEVKQKS